MTTDISRKQDSRGSAMMIALFAVAMTAFAVTAAVAIVQKSQDESTALNQMFQVRQAAESGLAYAMHPQVSNGDPLLQGRSPLGIEYHADLASEGARLNINALVKDLAGDRILRQLFDQWGLDETEVSTLVCSLQDWVDADDSTKLNGAEYDYYQKGGISDQLPRNRPFQNVNEMKQVRGMDALQARKPDWHRYFTTWSDGKLELNDAPAELIEVVCQVGGGQAGALVKAREEMKGNPDPKLRRWTDVSQPLALLGLPPEQAENIQAWTTVTGNVWRITSAAGMNKRQCTLVAVVRREGGRQKTLYRDEY